MNKGSDNMAKMLGTDGNWEKEIAKIVKELVK